jgi:hypothetical protein
MGQDGRQRNSILELMTEMLSEADRCLSTGRLETAKTLLQQVEEWLAITPPDESGERLAVRRSK